VRQVAALFCLPDSIYKTMPGVDVWDAERDAMLWPGGCPVVAHPPCRLWGRLRHFSTAPESELELARQSVAWVRQWGGILEHPSGSRLWKDQQMPRPGEQPDQWGGWSISVDQLWWGHPCRKATWLYIVGVAPSALPRLPDALSHTVTRTIQHPLKSRRRGGGLVETCEVLAVSKRDRSATPPAFAAWLVELARRSEAMGGAR
jgi:hypothetical protein